VSERRRTVLEDIPVPDLWPRIEAGLRAREAEGASRPGRAVNRRLVAAVVALGVFVGGLSVAWLALGRRGSPPVVPSHRPAHLTVRASFPGQHVTCSATLLNPRPHQGDKIMVSFAVVNGGSRLVRWVAPFETVTMTDATGRVLSRSYDNGLRVGNYSRTGILAPGSSHEFSYAGPPFPRTGPVIVRATCIAGISAPAHHGRPTSGHLLLPPIPVRVEGPRATPLG